MTIGQAAKESGFASSAIRYYEQEGVLPAPVRLGVRRQYTASVLERLAIIERAKACGFSLAEIRHVLYGFRESTQPSERWQAMARQKMAELDELARNIAAMRELLQRKCVCKDLAECGRRILERKRSTRKP